MSIKVEERLFTFIDISVAFEKMCLHCSNIYIFKRVDVKG